MYVFIIMTRLPCVFTKAAGKKNYFFAFRLRLGNVKKISKLFF